MTWYQHLKKYGWAYLVLVPAAAIFAFPFIWLITTSVKTDREMFPEKFTLFPDTPYSHGQSPFLDAAYYQNAVSDLTRPYLADLEKLIDQSGFTFPEAIAPQLARPIVAQGLAKKLEASLPVTLWHAPKPQLEAEFKRRVSPELVQEIFNQIYRWFGLGSLILRSEQLERVQFGTDSISVLSGWQDLTPNINLTSKIDHGVPCAAARFNFQQENFWRIEQTIAAPFPVENLQRVQLVLHPDDNWHRLYCYIERAGVRFAPEYAFYPQNFEWRTVSWQFPGPHERSNTIRTWIPLREVARGPQYAHAPQTIKIILEMQRSSWWQAWWGKLTSNYRATMNYIPFWRYTLTSFSVTTLNIVLSVLSCSMVAFAMARLNWPGLNFWFVIMLATMMIPAQVTLIPNFLIWKSLNAYNTLFPLWLGSAFASPFYIFLLRQFLKSIPKDMEDAARIDGCGYFRIYWHILLPLIKPSLTIVVVGTFTWSWNNFMGPLIFVADQRLYPLIFGLYAFAQQTVNNPGLVMAGSLLLTLPMILIFLFAQHYFIEGITLTGLKR